jgi:hypothetical protein
MRLPLLIVAALGIAGCVAQAQVIDEQAAIRLADKACASSWGAEVQRRGRGTWNVQANQWKARLVGDHWKVWAGDEAGPWLSVDVPSDGSPIDGYKTCKVQLQD